MSDPGTVWTCTGVSWRGGRPSVTMTDASGREASRPLLVGERFGVHVTGARFCVGVRRGDRRSCPFRAHLPATSRGIQCDACAAADPGRLLARDATVDHRRFRLYLACFGSGPLKVGISAFERDTERLQEQGALAFTWLAEGTHPAIRAAERVVSGAGIAVERRRRSSKLAGWWQAGTAAARLDMLLTAAQEAHSLDTWPSDPQRVPPEVVDHVGTFGLGTEARPLPRQLCDITHLREGATVVGQVRAVVGAEVLLDYANRTLILSGRRLAGWRIEPTTTLTASGYLTCSVQGIAPDPQGTLFWPSDG